MKFKAATQEDNNPNKLKGQRSESFRHKSRANVYLELSPIKWQPPHGSFFWAGVS